MSVSATYDAAYDTPASLAALAGNYTASSGHLDDSFTVKATITPGGVIAVDNKDCQFKGMAVPRTAVNVFDFTIEATLGVCIGGPGDPISGILYYDEATQQFHAFAIFHGNDMYFLIGSK